MEGVILNPLSNYMLLSIAKAPLLLITQLPCIQCGLTRRIPYTQYNNSNPAMLSKRDKILVQPWEDRRFKNHKNKVECALPAIDASAPPIRPHVLAKLKKHQREEDRKVKVERDNFSLLQRLSVIMNVNRLDNHWTKPHSNFHHKVGLYFPVEALKRKLSSAPSTTNKTNAITSERVKCFACEIKKKNKEEVSSISPLERPTCLV